MKNRTTNGDPDEIKASIEHTRSQMDETLDALSDRLKPRHLLDDLLDYWQSRRASGKGDGAHMKEAAGRVAGKAAEKAKDGAMKAKDGAMDLGRVVVDQVKQHPMPAMLIGAGIAWALMEKNRDESPDYDYDYQYEGDDVEAEFYQEELTGIGQGSAPESYALPSHYTEGDETPGMAGKFKSAGSQMKRRASEKYYGAKEGAARRARAIRQSAAEKSAYYRAQAAERAARLRERAGESYHQGVEAMKHTAHEHPLGAGLGFLALGVVAGLLLPSTRRENELVGPARDRLVNRTRSMAEEAARRGKHVAETAVEAVKSEAQAQGLTPEALKEKGRHVVDAARKTARDEGLTAEGLKQKAKTVASQTKQTTEQEVKEAAQAVKQS